MNTDKAQINKKQLMKLKNRIRKNLAFMQHNKVQLGQTGFSRLTQVHLAVIRELDNMMLFMRVADDTSSAVSHGVRREIVYDRDGHAKEINPREQSKIKQGWEQQFETKLHNPPCYFAPASNVYGIERIKASSNLPEPHHITDI